MKSQNILSWIHKEQPQQNSPAQNSPNNPTVEFLQAGINCRFHCACFFLVFSEAALPSFSRLKLL